MSPVAFLQRQLSRSCLSRRSRLLTTAACAGTNTDRDMYSLVSGPQQAAFSGIQRSHQLRSGCSIPRTILAQQCHTSNHGRRHPGSAYLQPRHQPRYACFLLVGMRSERAQSQHTTTNLCTGCERLHAHAPLGTCSLATCQASFSSLSSPPAHSHAAVSFSAPATPHSSRPPQPRMPALISSAQARPSSTAGAAGAATGSSAVAEDDDLEVTCLRVTVADLPGDEADNLSDVMLSFGAQSVV